MTEPELILDRCLQEIANGNLSAAECLKQYHEYADDLEALLLAAQNLEASRSIAPSAAARARMRARLRLHTASHLRRRSRWLQRASTLRLLRQGAAALAMVFLALGSLTWAAQAALPGDWLYGLKRTSEVIWIRVSKPELEDKLWLAERRLEEWIALKDDPRRTAQAHAAYQAALMDLVDVLQTPTPDSLLESLREQEQRLRESGLSAPRLDDLLEGNSTTPGHEAPLPGETPLPGLLPEALDLDIEAVEGWPSSPLEGDDLP